MNPKLQIEKTHKSKIGPNQFSVKANYGVTIKFLSWTIKKILASQNKKDVAF